MGRDIKQFVKDRDKAFTAFVMYDDWAPVVEYCATYGIRMPDDPDVMAAGIYKAVQEVTNMPKEVKHTAMVKCLKLGFKPYATFGGPKEKENSACGKDYCELE